MADVRYCVVPLSPLGAPVFITASDEQAAARQVGAVGVFLVASQSAYVVVDKNITTAEVAMLRSMLVPPAPLAAV